MVSKGVSVGANATGTATAECPPGELLTGGGHSWLNNVAPGSSTPRRWSSETPGSGPCRAHPRVRTRCTPGQSACRAEAQRDRRAPPASARVGLGAALQRPPRVRLTNHPDRDPGLTRRWFAVPRRRTDPALGSVRRRRPSYVGYRTRRSRLPSGCLPFWPLRISQRPRWPGRELRRPGGPRQHAAGAADPQHRSSLGHLAPGGNGGDLAVLAEPELAVELADLVTGVGVGERVAAVLAERDLLVG